MFDSLCTGPYCCVHLGVCSFIAGQQLCLSRSVHARVINFKTASDVSVSSSWFFLLYFASCGMMVLRVGLKREGMPM